MVTTNIYIKKIQKIHGDKYDYSKVNYINSKENVIIICPEHGEFSKRASEFLRGKGCPKCANINAGILRSNSIRVPQITTKTFIIKSREIHGDKYDYSKVDYIHSKEKVIIICPEHGEFLQRPAQHLSGVNCPKCSRIINDRNRTYTTQKFIEKAKEFHGDKYDYSKVDYIHSLQKVIIICHEHGEFKQLPNEHLRGTKCKLCSNDDMKLSKVEFIGKAKEIHGDKYDYSKVDYIHSKKDISIICHEHGEFLQRPNTHLSGANCPRCSIKFNLPEIELTNFINSLNIKTINNKKTLLHDREIDIYLPELKIAIEYNGLYWHSDLFKHDNYHKLKTDDCLKLGIKLIHIFEDEWLNKNNIVKSRLKNLFNLSENKIFARKTQIKNVSNIEAKNFLIENHLQGKINSLINIGLYHDDILVSLMCFGNLRKNLGNNTKENSYELLRFCNKLNHNVVGGASKLLNYFEKKYKPNELISYADRRWSSGNLYNKLGFIETHISPPNFFYINNQSRINRFQYRKDILISKYNCDPNLTARYFTKNILKLNRIYDSGNIVFKKYY